MKNPNIEICSLIESRMNEPIQEIKRKDSLFESDILDRACEFWTGSFTKYVNINKKLGKEFDGY